jgi:hypothetical protein
MADIVLAGVAIGSAFPVSPGVQTAAIGFIAAQACLAYFIAGIAKVVSPAWRSGSAVAAIMESETWGRSAVGAWLGANPRSSRLMAWIVIAAECSFPVVFVSPPWLAAVILGWGLLFHLFCALTMGLNTFLWAFGATYPAIWYVRSLLTF